MLADGIVGGRLVGLLGNIASPWGQAAFLVGRRTTSPRRDASAGAVTLVVGVATYYLLAAIRRYVLGNADVLWTVVELVAEALFLAVDRRVWRWNLWAEPYRLVDLAVLVALFLGSFALAAWIERDRRRQAAVFLAVAVAGVGGVVGFVVLRDIIVRIA